jgi:hypothetical protein
MVQAVPEEAMKKVLAKITGQIYSVNGGQYM